MCGTTAEFPSETAHLAQAQDEFEHIQTLSVGQNYKGVTTIQMKALDEYTEESKFSWEGERERGREGEREWGREGVV